jgi:hypothetical protein
LPPRRFPAPTADLTCVKGLDRGGFNQGRGGIIVVVGMETQPAKLLLNLKHLKWASSFLFSGGDNRLQVLTQPQEEIEPAVAVLEAKVHRGVTRISVDVEPSRPAIYQPLPKLIAHRHSPDCSMLFARDIDLTFRQVDHIECTKITKLFVSVFGACQKLDWTIAMISVDHRNLVHDANTD